MGRPFFRLIAKAAFNRNVFHLMARLRQRVCGNAFVASLVLDRLNLRLNVCSLLLKLRELRIPIIRFLPAEFSGFIDGLAGECVLQIGDFSVDGRNLLLEIGDLLLILGGGRRCRCGLF
jgi:hypothetical protein